MKKILLINGSPRGKGSSTRKVALEFLKGMQKTGDYELEEFIVAEHDIRPCKGCLSCWRSEEGNCVIPDDMAAFIESYTAAHVVVWSFPDYFYGLPATVKAVLERLLPIEHPYIETVAPGRTKHLRRRDLSGQKYLLFVTCGLYNLENNVDAIDRVFDHYYGDACQRIYTSGGDLFRNDFMRMYTLPYLRAMERAGAEYAENGSLCAETMARLRMPMMDLDTYLQFTNTQFLVQGRDESSQSIEHRRAMALMRLMALTYTPHSSGGEELVIQLELTDRSCQCQFQLRDGKCTLCEDGFKPFDLKVAAPISFFAPHQTLDQALASPKDRVDADFETLVALARKAKKSGKPKTMRFAK